MQVKAREEARQERRSWYSFGFRLLSNENVARTRTTGVRGYFFIFVEEQVRFAQAVIFKCSWFTFWSQDIFWTGGICSFGPNRFFKEFGFIVTPYHVARRTG